MEGGQDDTYASPFAPLFSRLSLATLVVHPIILL